MKFRPHLRHIALTFAAAAAIFTAAAQKKAEPEAEPASVEAALATPVIPAKQLNNVRSYMERQLHSFPKTEGTKIEMVNEYVIRYTIPASLLFEPNGFNLQDGSTDYLSPLLTFLRHHGKYKIILAMHSDDTGSESYRNILCENRILSLYDYFDSKSGNQALVYGFALGDTAPLKPNDSFKSRAENRRLEVYIAPGPTFLSELKVKK